MGIILVMLHLHINRMGQNGYALKHNPNGRTDINSASGQDILFKNMDTEKAKITSTGNFVVNTDTLFVDATNSRVGIGKTSPATALDVNGIIKQTGANWALTNAGVSESFAISRSIPR